MQDVPQIEAFSIFIHVTLTELIKLYFDFVLNCAALYSAGQINDVRG